MDQNLADIALAETADENEKVILVDQIIITIWLLQEKSRVMRTNS